jgi:UDP-N-acetylmuramoyl-L-alanyl-D-glutamate--2,6-diaminopimelate ligase
MADLRHIIQKLSIESIRGNPDRTINSICFDSRKVTQGDLFVAVRGLQTDGHEYISMAIEKGANSIICEEVPESTIANVCYILVKDSHESLAYVAAAFYDYPSANLHLVGITGTNGKTTVATLLYKLFRKLGFKVGLISTIEILIETISRPASHTTPDPLQINQALSQMVEQGCEYAFMEVSSHAAEQKRIAGLEFAGGVFTNLTHDHLDYHHSFREYLKAKQLFFNALPKTVFALTNADDRNGKIMMQNTPALVLSYGIKSMADFKARVIETHLEGNVLEISGQEIWTQLPGVFNAYNILAIYGTAVALGMDSQRVLHEISTLTAASGRFEVIRSDRGITGIVDYAHTPDALENVLKTIGQIMPGEGQIISIVGAGGNRDKTKRPLMAAIAVNYSHKVVLTSDNPRNEEPSEILNDMLKGLDPLQMRKAMVITDREEAIRAACAFAQPGDIILLAGKGHESYQEIRGVKYHFDDREVLKKYL